MRIVCPSCDHVFGVSDVSGTVLCPQCAAVALDMGGGAPVVELANPTFLECVPVIPTAIVAAGLLAVLLGGLGVIGWVAYGGSKPPADLEDVVGPVMNWFLVVGSLTAVAAVALVVYVQTKRRGF